MNYFAFSALVNILLSFSLGSFALIKGFVNPLSRKYFYFTFLICFWSFGYFFWQLSTNLSSAIFWSKFLMGGAILVPVAFLDFSIQLTDLNTQFRRLIFFMWGVSFVFFVLNFTTSLIVAGAEQKMFFPFWPIPGFLYIPFLGMFFFCVAFSLYVMFCAYHDSSANKKEQIKYSAFATALAFFGGSTNYFLWYDIPIPPILNILVAIHVLIIFYAIVKHRLMDIYVIIRKTFFYSIITGIVAGIYILSLALFEQVYRGFIHQNNSFWAAIFSAVMIALIYQPLRDATQKFVDEIFSMRKYDYQKILRDISSAMAYLTTVDRLLRLIVKVVVRSMSLQGASVALLDEEEKYYVFRVSEGFTVNFTSERMPVDSPLIEQIKKNREILVKDELIYNLSNNYLSADEKNTIQKIIDEMDKLKTAVCIPAFSKGKQMGNKLLALMCLGEKKSQDVFSEEDIKLFKTLSSQAAIALENAILHEDQLKNRERLMENEKMAAMGTMAAGIVHDLKNPLANISTLSQLMPSQWDNPDFKKSTIHMLPEEIERMRHIVDGLLDYSRQHELRLEPVNIFELVVKVTAVIAYETRKNNVKIIKNIPEDVQVLGDKDELTQVFVNLLTNANQSMVHGGEIAISAQKQGNEVYISVKDQGMGIPSETMRKIFNPFFTTKKSGTGLGLAITQKIIREHKGRIEVESKVGQGTTFTVILPAA